jgi:hypothetical protein
MGKHRFPNGKAVEAKLRLLLDAAANGSGTAFETLRDLFDGDVDWRRKMTVDQFSEFRLKNCLKLKTGLLHTPQGLLYECAKCEACLCPAFPVVRHELGQEDQARDVMPLGRYCIRVMRGEYNHAAVDLKVCERCDEPACDFSSVHTDGSE